MYQVISGTVDLSLKPELFVMNTKKLYLQCQTSLGAVNITLPEISKFGGTWGFEIYVNDVDGNAATNNIMISPNASDKINGVNAPVIINTNGGSGVFEIIDTTTWQFPFANSVPVNAYKKYVALLNQSGTDAPVATVLENTLGGIPAWNYIGAGQYQMVLTGAFPDATKVLVLQEISTGIFITGIGISIPVITVRWEDTNTLQITTFINGGTPTDSYMSNASIEIRVYA